MKYNRGMDKSDLPQAPAHHAEPGPDALPLPRFTLQHLFTGMTALGIVLGMAASIPPPELFDAPPSRDFYVVASLLVGLIYAGPIAALLWGLLFGWRRDATFPREPGHWFLILLGITVIERWASLQLLRFAGPRHALPWLIWSYIWMLPGLMGAAAAFLAARCMPEGNWRFAFEVQGVLKVLLVAVAFEVNLAPPPNPVRSFIGVLVLGAIGIGGKLLILLAVTEDKQSRSTLHRLGIYAAFEEFAVCLVMCCTFPAVQ
jgi:hypothetical protein